MLNKTQRCSQCRQAYLKSSFVKNDGRCIVCRSIAAPLHTGRANTQRPDIADAPFEPRRPDPWQEENNEAGVK